ncbi:MAG TPA: ABC transporter substrate-binding protein, partial [Pseudonocardiaceae bacterium]|nr:ABC transporter substrate-binding protein [Pseudonocardiaceae bacterium]
MLTDDPVTNVIQNKMAESFTSSDGGSTFQLKLRPGLTFSDGSPLDATAVKFNWDRIKNPTLGSQTRLDAMLIASTAVADPLTLTVKLVSPMPNFAQVVISDSLNWIASPTALQGGQAAFDANPIGAGPYTLQQWTRQDKVELAKNPRYWDPPRPYLDHLTVRFSLDSNQRVNTLMSGGADVEVETSWTTIAKARAAGFPVNVGAFSGGQYMAMNMRRAPFNDIRARQAVAEALDMNAINLAVYEGKAQTVPTLFTESSPFYSPDLKLLQPDKATAQRLFDELAAEGKPVSFVFKYFPSLENKALA